MKLRFNKLNRLTKREKLNSYFLVKYVNIIITFSSQRTIEQEMTVMAGSNFSIFNIKDFGAVADGETSATQAIEQALQGAAKTGGATIYVPPGKYLTGPIKMRSNTNLYLEAGAEIKFSNDLSEYPVLNQRWEGSETSVYAPMIYGENLNNVAITGHGVLNGQGKFWWDSYRSKSLTHARPRMIGLVRCKRILIDGISLINSPAWTVNPVLCEDITINNLHINNPAESPNTDGINPDSCKNVHITNCHIDVGDDCIAIKSGTETSKVKVPCENITIMNCTMAHGHGGIVIGSETSGCIHSIVISNCIFEGTDRGIRIKSRRGRGGVVQDIQAANLIMRDIMCPIVLNLYYGCGAWGDASVEDRAVHSVDQGTPKFHNMQFTNIMAREVHAAAAFIYGLPEMPISNILLDNIRVTMAKNAIAYRPAMMGGLADMKKQGVLCTNVQGLRFSNVVVEGHQGRSIVVNNGGDIEYMDNKNKD